MLKALKHINAAFGCQATILPPQVSIDRWSALGSACANIPESDRPHLNDFYSSRNSKTALLDIEEIFHQADRDDQGEQALEVMKTVMERQGDPSGVTRMAIIALIEMLSAYAPASGFRGFTQWGPGDNANAISNLEAHFLKHVCRQPVDLNFGVMEAVKFWKDLNIKLTLSEYKNLTINPPDNIKSCFDGDKPIAGDRLKKFFIYHGLQNQPRLTQFIKNQALNRYRDFAIDRSKFINNAIVHSNGTRVFISGSVEGIFIIGRFDNGQLGISSCYQPLDMTGKLRGARSNMCWSLSG